MADFNVDQFLDDILGYSTEDQPANTSSDLTFVTSENDNLASFFDETSAAPTKLITAQEDMRLKLADPTIKTVVYRDALFSLYEQDPSAFLAYIQQHSIKSGRDVEPDKLSFVPANELYFNPEKCPNMTAVMEETHLLLIDGVLYDNTLTRLEFPGEIPKGVTAIYAGLAQQHPKYGSLTYEHYGVWRRNLVTDFFARAPLEYSRSLFSMEAGKLYIYYLTNQLRSYTAMMEEYYAKLLDMIGDDQYKNVDIGEIEFFCLYPANQAQAKLFRAVFKKANVRVYTQGRVLYYTTVMPHFYADWLFASNATKACNSTSQQRDVNYLLSYLRSLPGRPTMLSLRPWFENKRIDGEPMCDDYSQRVATTGYRIKSECKYMKCYCYNPISRSADGLLNFLSGPLLSYIKIAADLADQTDSRHNVGFGLSLHFCDNRQAVCPVCRLPASRCICATKPDEALRKRGLYNSNHYKRYIVLGKPTANGEESMMHKVSFMPDLSYLVPSKRSHHVICVPDGTTPASYDMNNVIVKGCSHSVTFVSIPRCIYEHPEFEADKIDSHIMNFFLRPGNKLANASCSLDRVRKSISKSSILDAVKSYISEFMGDGRFEKKRKNQEQLVTKLRQLNTRDVEILAAQPMVVDDLAAPEPSAPTEMETEHELEPVPSAPPEPDDDPPESANKRRRRASPERTVE